MFAFVQAAGWPVWFLVLASVIALALIVERSLSLRRTRVLPHNLATEVLGAHRDGRASPEFVQRLEAASPLGRVFAAALRHRGADVPMQAAAVEDAGRRAAHELERFLPALGTIASIAPLLGLFGTVVGMIEIFGAASPGGSDPRQLAHGISIALYNTAFGLAVAIPSLVAWRHFRARVDGLVLELESQARRFGDALRGGRP